MKKIFISQNMSSATEENILKIRTKIKEGFINVFGNHFEFIESYKPELKLKHPLEALGHSLTMMAKADIVLIPYNYNDYNGTSIEYKVANIYEIRTIKYLIKENQEVSII